MRHREAVDRIPDLLEERLAVSESAEVERHLESCQECRETAALYRQLSSALGAGQQNRHATSEELARIAVAGATPDGAVAAHVEVCCGCSEDLKMARAALRRARRPPWLPAWGQLDLAPMRLFAAFSAAGLLAVAMIVWLLGASQDAPQVVVLSEGSLAGFQRIEGAVSVRAGAVRLEPHSDVRIRGSKVVALGDGFVVDSGARLTVELGSPTKGRRVGSKKL